MDAGRLGGNGASNSNQLRCRFHHVLIGANEIVDSIAREGDSSESLYWFIVMFFLLDSFKFDDIVLGTTCL